MITKYGNLDTRLWASYTPPMLVNAHSTQTTRGCFKQNSRTDMQILSTRANVENQLKLKINFSLCHARSRACNHVFVFSYADYCTKTIRSQVSQCIFCDLFVWIKCDILVALENWLPKMTSLLQVLRCGFSLVRQTYSFGTVE